MVRLFRLPREEYNRMIKLYPSDEDIIFQNLALLSEDDKVKSSRRPQMEAEEGTSRAQQ